MPVNNSLMACICGCVLLQAALLVLRAKPCLHLRMYCCPHSRLAARAGELLLLGYGTSIDVWPSHLRANKPPHSLCGTLALAPSCLGHLGMPRDPKDSPGYWFGRTWCIPTRYCRPSERCLDMKSTVVCDGTAV